MVYAQDPPVRAAWLASRGGHALPIALFLAGFTLLVATMRVWAGRLSREIDGRAMTRSAGRFGWAMFFAKIIVAAGFVVGLYGLGWGAFVLRTFVPSGDWPIMTPATLVAITPAFLAWMGLWWSYYPADRAMREQSAVTQLEAGLPVHGTPPFRRYLVAQL